MEGNFPAGTVDLHGPDPLHQREDWGQELKSPGQKLPENIPAMWREVDLAPQTTAYLHCEGPRGALSMAAWQLPAGTPRASSRRPPSPAARAQRARWSSRCCPYGWGRPEPGMRQAGGKGERAEMWTHSRTGVHVCANEGDHTKARSSSRGLGALRCQQGSGKRVLGRQAKARMPITSRAEPLFFFFDLFLIEG